MENKIAVLRSLVLQDFAYVLFTSLLSFANPGGIGSAVFCLPCWGTSGINRTVPSGWSTRLERVGNTYGPNWCKVPQSRRRLSTKQGGLNANGIGCRLIFSGLVLSALVLVICRWLCRDVACNLRVWILNVLVMYVQRTCWNFPGNRTETWCPFLMGRDRIIVCFPKRNYSPENYHGNGKSPFNRRYIFKWFQWLFLIHQEFQVPKMEILSLFRLFFEWGAFPYISRIHTAYIGEDSSNSGTVPDMFGGFSIVVLVFWGEIW